jgi:hypothetical protein
MRDGPITVKPFGLSQSLATFAKNLFADIPAEIVIPISRSTRLRISFDISVALPL